MRYFWKDDFRFRLDEEVGGVVQVHSVFTWACWINVKIVKKIGKCNILVAVL
jgi:hypothetical protein